MTTKIWNQRENYSPKRCSKVQSFICLEKYIFNLLPKIKDLLFYTSLIFLTNVLFALYKKKYIYAFLFLNLTITSIIIHSKSNIHINKKIIKMIKIIDKIFIYLIVAYGLYNFCSKIEKSNIINTILILVTFLYCIYVYHFGSIIKEYCFDSKIDIANTWHGSMHLAGSVGHNLIMLL